MSAVFEVWDAQTGSWLDKTGRLTVFRRRITSSQSELVEGELADDEVRVGDSVRMREGGVTSFEGVVYEVDREHRSGDVKRCSFTAYTDLIRYDTYVVFKTYTAGTSAGAIIRDLASLETDVDVSDVDDGPSLAQDWVIEGVKALEVMQDVSKGVNYWLWMRPGRRLYFKPKTAGASRGTIDDTIAVEAEYSEDRWRYRNRVVVVGANGQVLADVSEPPGDLPETINNPFLSDVNEAQRIAQTQLSIYREYGRSLTVTLHRKDYEALAPNLGDTFTINLPSLGLNNIDMVLLEIEYEFGSRSWWRRLTFGGHKELLEDYLARRFGGEEATRFGPRPDISRSISAIYTTIDSVNTAVKIQARAKTVRYVNRPPMNIVNGVNVKLAADGGVELASGYTSGGFTVEFTPQSKMFQRWSRAHYTAELKDGSVQVDLQRSDGSVIASNIPQDYEIPYLPAVAGVFTEQNASQWDAVGGSLSDSEMAVISFWSIRGDMSVGATSMELSYPRDRSAGWDLGPYKYMRLYLFSYVDDPSLKVRLHNDASNYYEAALNHLGGSWRGYEIVIDTMTAVGSPNKNSIKWLSIITTAPTLFVDTDWVFQPLKNEKLVMKFSLSRPTASSLSPIVKLAKIVWREG